MDLPHGYKGQFPRPAEGDEIHIEVIAPQVLPTQPFGLPADEDTDDRGLPYFVKGASSDGPTPEASGITKERGTGGMSAHIHPFHESLRVTLTANERPRASLTAI